NAELRRVRRGALRLERRRVLVEPFLAPREARRERYRPRSPASMRLARQEHLGEILREDARAVLVADDVVGGRLRHVAVPEDVERLAVADRVVVPDRRVDGPNAVRE